MSDFDAEREANIARNRALLAELDVKLDIPEPRPKEKKAKPVQPAKREKRRARTPPPPRETRQSSRLKKTIPDPNETPRSKRKREKEEEEERAMEAERMLEEEQRERAAKRPRHDDLDLGILGEELEDDERRSLSSVFKSVVAKTNAASATNHEAFTFDDDKEENAAVSELKDKLKSLKIVSRAKVTEDRVYSAAYHPEISKDLIFFGDKHGQLGIWDARASTDDGEEETSAETREGGKHWRLQPHWPATAKSSLSSIRFDPKDAHSIYTSSYDGTIRRTVFESGVSQEVYSFEEILPTSIDITPTGHEMWVSDGQGGLTHLDLREDKSKARWYQLSDQKIGSVSINPIESHLLLAASNSRTLKVWDSRKLATLKSTGDSNDFDSEVVNEFVSSKAGEPSMRGECCHGKSVSSAYWDPRGRSIVSTSYDDTLKLWDIKPSVMLKDKPFPSFRPFAQIKHNCQVGRWVTILRAQWTPNPDVYPHFTVGNMDQSVNIYSCKGDLLAKLADKTRVTAVQAVTCSHPRVVERVATGNASGRCVLWAPMDSD